MSKENSKEIDEQAQKNKLKNYYRIFKIEHHDNSNNSNNNLHNEEVNNKININNKNERKISDKFPMDSKRKSKHKNVKTSEAKAAIEENVNFQNKNIKSKMEPSKNIMILLSYERDQVNLYTDINNTKKDINNKVDNLGSNKEKEDEKSFIFTYNDYKINIINKNDISKTANVISPDLNSFMKHEKSKDNSSGRYANNSNNSKYNDTLLFSEIPKESESNISEKIIIQGEDYIIHGINKNSREIKKEDENINSHSNKKDEINYLAENLKKTKEKKNNNKVTTLAKEKEDRNNFDKNDKNNLKKNKDKNIIIKKEKYKFNLKNNNNMNNNINSSLEAKFKISNRNTRELNQPKLENAKELNLPNANILNSATPVENLVNEIKRANDSNIYFTQEIIKSNRELAQNIINSNNNLAQNIINSNNNLAQQYKDSNAEFVQQIKDLNNNILNEIKQSKAILYDLLEENSQSKMPKDNTKNN